MMLYPKKTRNALLMVMLVAPIFACSMMFTGMLPRFFPRGAGGVVEAAGSADFLHGMRMRSSEAGSVYDVRLVAQTLGEAYENALNHETLSQEAPGAELGEADSLLENAAIRFSSRVLYEMARGSCQQYQAVSMETGNRCILQDESVGLSALSDTLSSAASRLESLRRSLPAATLTAGPPDLVRARVGSLEHLYRMAFAVSRMYLDRSQSGAYLEAAHEQLGLARQSIEAERALCSCSDQESVARTLELSQVEDQLSEMRNYSRVEP